ncbi:MAG: PDZ domain-containing protein [Dehalococcoidia bacterium]|nr:PDZ domain-containing protein [Dehalococcoidia bacterium]
MLAAAGASTGGGGRAADRRPFGLRIADASHITRERGMTPLFGAYVDRVASGSAAERAGFLAGDIVTEVNMKPVGGASDLEKVLATAPPGARLSFVFIRANKRGKTEAVV